MIKSILLYIFFILFIYGCHNIQQDSNILQYPHSKKTDSFDVYFGQKIQDPYRWLEYDTLEETKSWIKNQNNLTEDYLQSIPYRDKIKTRLHQIWNHPQVSTPFKKGNFYFYLKNDGLQNHDVLYIQNIKSGIEKPIIDPNEFSEDGSTAMTNFRISNDVNYIAYMLAPSGQDWNIIQILDIKTGKKLEERIDSIKFSDIAWYKNGFFYSQYAHTKNSDKILHVVKYHKINEPVKNDEVVYSNPSETKRNYFAYVSDDEKYLLLFEFDPAYGMIIHIRPLTPFINSKYITINKGLHNSFTPVYNVNDVFYFVTNYNAPNNKLISVNLKNPGKEHWKDIIPEKQDLLKSVSVAGKGFIAQYITDVKSKLIQYSISGKFERNIQLPGTGNIERFNGVPDDDKAFYSFVRFTSPSTIYEYNTKTGHSTEFFKPEFPVDTRQFITRQVFVTSFDGTKIPMFIFHKKGIKKDGANPTILYGYGGFMESIYPEFKQKRIIWLENNGIYAVVNLRGGGEYGEQWHSNGALLKKKNVFDDCIAAAEYLVVEGYTSPSKLALTGRSNGGLLVAAVTNLRPDLFAVSIPEYGVMDMLRYQNFTSGWLWEREYGSSSDSAFFKYLHSYSPLHNIRENGNMPAILALTSVADDRVVPAHSYKYIATMQEKSTKEKPILIRIDTKTGHGEFMGLNKQIEEYTDVFSFLFRNMGITPYKDGIPNK